MAPFSAFPSEILSLILEHLSHRRDLYANMVMNKQLYQIAQPLLWRTPQLHDETAADQFYTALTMACYSLTSPLTTHYDPAMGMGPWIRKFKLHGTFWNNSRLLVLLKYIPNLEDLCLTYTTELTGENLSLLPQQCSKLKTLHLFMVPGATQTFINALGQHCHQLTQLTMHDCYGLGGDTFTALQHCTLHTLALGFIPHVMQTDKSILNLILHHPWLTTLSLNFWQHASSSASSSKNCGCDFMSKLFYEAEDAWPHLISLSIADCTHWSGCHWLRSLVPFLQHHPRLQKLHLRALRFKVVTHISANYYGLTDVALPSLTHLSIINTADICAHELKKWILLCPQLRFVTIWRSCIGLPMKRGAVMSCGAECHSEPTKGGPFLHHLDEEDIIKLRFGC